MAEWLGRALQKLVQRFESARCLKTQYFVLGFLLYLFYFLYFVLDVEPILGKETFDNQYDAADNQNDTERSSRTNGS